MRVLLILGLAAVAAGCGGRRGAAEAEGTPGERALSELAGVLPLLPKPPTKLADLSQYRETAPLAYESIRTGEVVVVWGVTMPGEGDAGKGTTDVVAYEKDAPTAGGFVLLHNGTVKKMTAAEFNAARKAK
jgi:hypothetical protein